MVIVREMLGWAHVVRTGKERGESSWVDVWVQVRITWSGGQKDN